MKGILFVATVVVLFIAATNCIVCHPKFCDSVKCQEVTGCDEPNQVVRKGGFCRCCDHCHTLLAENETCSTLHLHLRGSPPPTTYCGDGLFCHEEERKCKTLESTNLISKDDEAS